MIPKLTPFQGYSAACTLLASLTLAACSSDTSGGGTGGERTFGGAATSGGSTSGGSTFGGAPSSGGATQGGATSGGATSGGATSGGSTSAGATSGGANNGGAASGGASGGGAGGVAGMPGTGGAAGSSSGGTTSGGGGSAGVSGGGSSSGGAGGATTGGGSSGGAGGATTGGSSSGGSSGGSAGKGGSGGTSTGGTAGSGGSGTGGSTGDTCKAPDFGLHGYAKSAGVTGGKGGSTVRVSSLSALEDAVGSDSAAIVVVTGRITGSTGVEVGSNKTIVGEGTAGELQGVGLDLGSSTNIIIRNLKIHHVRQGAGDDAIGMSGAKRVWIDHCELWADAPVADAPDSVKDRYDGLIDLTDSTQNVTVSWSYLHDHYKGILCGSAADDTADRRLTMHHNYFKNMNSRLPSYRGGQAHVYNNLFETILTSGVNTRENACVRVERNHFISATMAIATLDEEEKGNVQEMDNILESSTRPTAAEDIPGTCTWNGGYTYTADPVSCVKAMVQQHAGVGKIDPLMGLP